MIEEKNELEKKYTVFLNQPNKREEPNLDDLDKTKGNMEIEENHDFIKQDEPNFQKKDEPNFKKEDEPNFEKNIQNNENIESKEGENKNKTIEIEEENLKINDLKIEPKSEPIIILEEEPRTEEISFEPKTINIEEVKNIDEKLYLPKISEPISKRTDPQMDLEIAVDFNLPLRQAYSLCINDVIEKQYQLTTKALMQVIFEKYDYLSILQFFKRYDY